MRHAYSTHRPMSRDAIVVTGGDSVYFPLIEELRQSLLAG